MARARERRALTALLNVLQPLARLRGRLDHGLTPWRRRGKVGLAVPAATDDGRLERALARPRARLAIIEEGLRADGVAPVLGGDFDRWDLEVRGGFFGCARLRLAVEEHGGGRQLARFRLWPRIGRLGIVPCSAPATVALVAGIDGDLAAASVLGALAFVCLVLEVDGAARATAALRRAVERQRELADFELAADLQRARARIGEVTERRHVA